MFVRAHVLLNYRRLFEKSRALLRAFHHAALVPCQPKTLTRPCMRPSPCGGGGTHMLSSSPQTIDLQFQTLNWNQHKCINQFNQYKITSIKKYSISLWSFHTGHFPNYFSLLTKPKLVLMSILIISQILPLLVKLY